MQAAHTALPPSSPTQIASSGGGPPRPLDLSPECSSFLDACLSLDPAHRATAAQLLTHPFLHMHA